MDHYRFHLSVTPPAEYVEFNEQLLIMLDQSVVALDQYRLGVPSYDFDLITPAAMKMAEAINWFIRQSIEIRQDQVEGASS
jgi:hypothetical protein